MNKRNESKARKRRAGGSALASWENAGRWPKKQHLGTSSLPPTFQLSVRLIKYHPNFIRAERDFYLSESMNFVKCAKSIYYTL